MEDPIIAMLMRKAAAPIESPIEADLLRLYPFLDLNDVERFRSKYTDGKM